MQIFIGQAGRESGLDNTTVLKIQFPALVESLVKRTAGRSRAWEDILGSPLQGAQNVLRRLPGLLRPRLWPQWERGETRRASHRVNVGLGTSRGRCSVGLARMVQPHVGSGLSKYFSPAARGSGTYSTPQGLGGGNSSPPPLEAPPQWGSAAEQPQRPGPL